MTTVTLHELSDAIAALIATIPAVKELQRHDELKESINTKATVQVYPQSWSQDSSNAVHQTTFRGRIRLQETLIHVDVYARQRSSLADDISATIILADAINAKLESTTPDDFGITGLQAFHWEGQRLIFEYGDVQYAGVRYIITLTTF